MATSDEEEIWVTEEMDPNFGTLRDGDEESDTIGTVSWRAGLDEEVGKEGT